MGHKICESCGAEIYFCTTKKGKLIPVNSESLDVYERVAMDNDREIKFVFNKHISHFATCSNANYYRKKK